MDAQTVCLCWIVVWEALDVAVIGIDEGKFSPDLEFCKVIVNVGKTVIVAALDRTLQRKAFGSFLNLLLLTKSIVKLTSLSMEFF
ncbi:Thymidine kinase, cytosolic [Lemmus lemmus]